jgi:dsRNA-specific ribonuclease
VGVFVGSKLVGQGVGPSKQAGQVAAASAALELYR